MNRRSVRDIDDMVYILEAFWGISHQPEWTAAWLRLNKHFTKKTLAHQTMATSIPYIISTNRSCERDQFLTPHKVCWLQPRVRVFLVYSPGRNNHTNNMQQRVSGQHLTNICKRVAATVQTKKTQQNKFPLRYHSQACRRSSDKKKAFGLDGHFFSWPCQITYRSVNKCIHFVSTWSWNAEEKLVKLQLWRGVVLTTSSVGNKLQPNSKGLVLWTL